MITKIGKNNYRITEAVVDIEKAPVPNGKGIVKYTNRDVTVQDHRVYVTCRLHEHVRNKVIAAFMYCKASLRKDDSRYISLKKDLTFAKGELDSLTASVRKVYEAARLNWEKGGAE